MHDDATIAAVLATVPVSPRTGPWARAVALDYLQGPPPGEPAGSPAQPLWPASAPRAGGRFTPKGTFPSVYLATDPMTALAEVEAVFENAAGAFQYVDHRPYAVFSVDGIVPNVLDLTDGDVCSQLGLDDQELRGPWRRAQERAALGKGPLPATQRLGQVAHDSSRIGGLLFPSAKVGGAALPGINLVVFTDRLALAAGTAYLAVHTPSRLLAQRIP